MGYSLFVSNRPPPPPAAGDIPSVEAQAVPAGTHPTSPSLLESRRTAIVTAAERVSPSVVTVSVRQVRIVRSSPFASRHNDFFNQFFRDLFPEHLYRQEVANMGSGVIIDPEGYIITNSHVVEAAEAIEVVLSDGRQFDARLIGIDPWYDLALIKIEGDALPCAPLGDSNDLVIGEWVIAIGNPFGYLLNNTQPSVTAGVISALHRDIEPEGRMTGIYKDMIQTDAAINPGNSGGPLVNGSGEVIGINTFIFTKSGGSLGIGFATPVNAAKRIVEEFLTYGEVRRIWFGASVVEITGRTRRLLKLPSRDGVIVSIVDPGSPAEDAGIQVVDVIKAINGEKISGVDEARRALHGVQVGDVLELEILRDGAEMQMTLVTRELSDRWGEER